MGGQKNISEKNFALFLAHYFFFTHGGKNATNIVVRSTKAYLELIFQIILIATHSSS